MFQILKKIYLFKFRSSIYKSETLTNIDLTFNKKRFRHLAIKIPKFKQIIF